jgi:hypothetical protein
VPETPQTRASFLVAGRGGSGQGRCASPPEYLIFTFYSGFAGLADEKYYFQASHKKRLPMKGKIMKSGYFLIAACLIIPVTAISCGTAAKIKHPYTLNEKYAGVNLSGRKIVVVLPDDSNIVIHNKKDVADDYGGQNASPESRIRKYYFPIFFQTLKNFASGD